MVCIEEDLRRIIFTDLASINWLTVSFQNIYILASGLGASSRRWTLPNDKYRKKTDVPKLSVINAILAALPRSELDFALKMWCPSLRFELASGLCASSRRWTLLNDEYRKKTDVPKLSVLNAILAALPRSELDFAL